MVQEKGDDEITLILRPSELEDLLSLEEAIAVLEATYVEEAAGNSSPHTPIRIHIPRGTMRVVSGALLESDLVGTRISVPGTDGIVTLFELSTGEPIAVMGTRVSAMRSTASIGVAIKHLSSPDADTLAMIGTGNNALGFIRAALALRPVKDIRVFSRSKERRAAFVEEASSALGCHITASESSDDAIEGADIVLLGTNAMAGAIDPSHLKSKVLVCSFGFPTEVPDELYCNASVIFSSSKRQEEKLGLYKTYIDVELRHPMVDATNPDMPKFDDLVDLGVAVTGDWRLGSDDGIVLFRESQGGVGDLALAHFVYERAKALHRGVEIDLSAKG